MEADISMNGIPQETPLALQEMFQKQFDDARYTAESFDCQTLNPNYNVGADESSLGPDKDGKKMSILVLVSGQVKYSKGGAIRGFTDTFVLVPNWAAHRPNVPKGTKGWLIQSQQFRMVL